MITQHVSTMIAIYRYREDQKLFRVFLSTKSRIKRSRVATPAVRLRLAVAQAKYCDTFQLTHMPRGNHAQSIASNGDQKTFSQHSQLRQHGEFRHVTVSERQRSRPCGQNLRVPFHRTVLPPEVEGALEQWRPTARQKRSYLHHQGEFQRNYFDFVSLHHSDHDGVVRIFVGHSEVVKRLLFRLITLRGTIFPIPGV